MELGCKPFKKEPAFHLSVPLAFGQPPWDLAMWNGGYMGSEGGGGQGLQACQYLYVQAGMEYPKPSGVQQVVHTSRMFAVIPSNP